MEFILKLALSPIYLILNLIFLTQNKLSDWFIDLVKSSKIPGFTYESIVISPEEKFQKLVNHEIDLIFTAGNSNKRRVYKALKLKTNEWIPSKIICSQARIKESKLYANIYQLRKEIIRQGLSYKLEIESSKDHGGYRLVK